MRRGLAITIVLVFGFSLAAPLFAVDAASSLPECCRRNGSHHCAGGMTTDPTARTVSSIAPKCPNFPKAIAATQLTAFTPEVTRSTGTPLYAHPAAAPQTAARYRVAYARSRQKRGPPIILL